MKEDQDYIRDIAQMRSMMERSTKFFSLSGIAGLMAGIYASAGAYVAWKIFDFNPNVPVTGYNLINLILLATIVLLLSIITAILLSYRKANKRNEKFWNATSRRFVINLAVPLIAGGVLILIFLSKGLIGLAAPATLIFYGLAQYNAGKYTYEEMRSLGLICVALGLLGAYYTDYGLLFWTIGFGLVHIIYGIYLHYRYER